MSAGLPYCTSCGTRNEADAVFCESCGHPLAEIVAPAGGESAPGPDLRPRRRWVVPVVGLAVLLGAAYLLRAPLSLITTRLATPEAQSAPAALPGESTPDTDLTLAPPPAPGAARPVPPRPPSGARSTGVVRPPPAPTSQGRRTGKQIIQFDRLGPGWLPTEAFSGAGVRWVRGEGEPGIADPERNMVLPDGAVRVLLLHGGPVTSLTLEFTPPVKRFGLTRIGTAGGASVPTWTLEAFDAEGSTVDLTGEEHGLPPEPERFAVSGPGIARAVLRTDNRFGEGTWATWNSLPVVGFELER